ncbi:MAG: cadmium-translocating P-type ATPase [Clostridia bacterium]|nr:cadmium-translocating P-type ATPase [Clostridia bacterium]
MKRFIKENKLTLIRLALTICLLISALIFSFYFKTVSTVLYIMAYALSACLIIFNGLRALFVEKSVDEKLLMTVASLGAMIIGEFFEAVLIAVLFEIGELIEDLAVTKSRGSIETLSSIRPDRARLKGESEMIDAKDIRVGATIEVLPGERIPLDGSIVEGFSTIDTSVITGESDPKEARVGAEVFAGTLNLTAPICIQVKRTVNQSAAQRIIDLSQNALDKKTSSEKFIKKFASIYTPVIIAVAVFVAVIPPLFNNFDFITWVYRACAVLAIACPCALVISIPLAYFCAIGYASKKGILIKNSSVFEKLERLNTIAFDKTGTLTKPNLHVTRVETFEDVTKRQLLEYLCIAEMKSNHPIATAVRREATKLRLTIEEGSNYEEKAGFGVECDSKYGHIKAGNKFYIDAIAGANIGSVFVALDGKYIGYICIGEELKANSKKAFDQLRELGISKKIILSGDKQYKVDAVAKALLADGAYSNLLPEYKLDAIDDIIKTTENCVIAYCGDGINDLPALAMANVGIAMGAIGSDIAVEKSDIVIMDDDIEKIPLSIVIARKTKRTVIANIVFAIVAKLTILGLSIFGIAPMLFAVLGDVGILLLTIINSTRAGR